MSPAMTSIIQTIEEEFQRSRDVEDAFLRALCLFETHYQKRPSSLLSVCHELEGEEIDNDQAAHLSGILVRFIEELSAHASVTAAVWLLALTKDPSYQAFFIAQLRRYLTWRNPVVVYQLLLALEGLGERVFYDTDGQFIGSRSGSDTDTNFGVAARYLERHDMAP